MPIATPQGTLDFKSVDKVTFVGASSNTVIDTTTGSLGVGVGVGGPTSNLHVVGNTRLEGDINMLHTANTASIKLNSNVVTEFPRSKKLIKYPRVALNSASQDGYVVTASTDGYVSTKFHRYDPFRPFVSGTGTNSANGWHSGPPDISVANNWDQTFDTSGYNKDLTSYGVGGYAGTSIAGIESEWLKLELPHKIVLSHFYYQHRDGQSKNYAQAPRDFRILGSNDDVNWDTIQTFTDEISLPEGKTLTAEASKGYKYLAFVVTKTWVTSGTAHLTLKNLEYYGVPEYDPEAYGTDVTLKSEANIPNTDWLDIYYDGQDYTSMQSTIDNKTGVSTYDATPINGVGFDATQKAFTFDANSSQYLSSSTPISGNYVHTISMWFKGTNLTPSGGDTLMWVGDNTDNKRIEIYIENDRINYNFRTNDCTAHTTFQNDRWYHLTCTYNGTQGSAGREIYVDGQRLSTTHSGNLADLNITNSTLNVGGFSGTSTTYMFSGFIANFRLFNRVLTSDEIYQLYAYQKEEFGHGDLSMTLKAGRLGIGTSEPKAVLDVRGDLRVNGHAFPETMAPRYYTSIKTGKFTGASNPILTGFDNVDDGHSEAMGWEVHINFNITSSSDIEVYMDGFYTSEAPTTHRSIVEHGTRRQRQDNSGTTWYHDKFYLGSYIAANHAPLYSVIRILNPHEQHSSIHAYNTNTMRFHAWGETIYVLPGVGTTVDYAIGNLRASGANQRLHGIRLTPQSGTLTGAYTIFAIK